VDESQALIQDVHEIKRMLSALMQRVQKTKTDD